MSKKNQSHKVSARELTARTDALLNHILQHKDYIGFLNNLFGEYIEFESNTDKFAEYLKEKNESKNEVRGGSDKDKPAGKGKQKPAQSGGKTRVRPKAGGKKERAVLDTKQSSK